MFTDRKTGWSFGGGGNQGEIAKSTDSCKTWKKVASSYQLDFVDASAGNERNICAIGKTAHWSGIEDTTKLLYSNDGGVTWKTTIFGRTNDRSTMWIPARIQFMDSLHVWMIGRDGYGNANFLYWSSDAGRNWALRNYSNVIYTNGFLPVVEFFDTLKGICYKGNSRYSGIVIAKTYDGGKTWDSISVMPDSIVRFVHTFCFPDTLNGWALGLWGLTAGTYKTTDGGRTWKLDAWIGGPPEGIVMHSKTLGWCLRDTRLFRYGLIDNVRHNNFNEGGFHLEQNYPNPFNPEATIRYELPTSGHVTLSVYNLLGERIAVLADEVKEAGAYQVPFDGSKLSSGVYIYKLTAGENVISRKMILMR